MQPLLTYLPFGLLSVCLSSASNAGELRPLAADRPDATESPQTVDKGHWQIETSILGFAQDKRNGMTSRRYEVFNTNLKYGLTDSMDIHFVMTPYVKQEIEQAGVTNSVSSYSDLEVRSKINLWGNDGGASAMALLPYIKLPAGDFSNDKTEAGMIVTYGTELSGFGVGVQAQLDYVHDETENEMTFAGSYTAVLGYDIAEKLGGYIEYIGEYDVDANYIPYASFGLTYQADKNLQWDVGSKQAFTDDGQDFEVFFGFTQRY
ncbi:transporter [Thiomicrorhabdus sp. 6S2-11]|uniref:Transporter n=1 Tax=Thiomicrorhabdus marina TaxID=2818442 RepID=A0ABS3Q671_9GAMM|nr:transporter [Thiomicrorhabdus marina]MBO1927845.1 transporter [Thiomicrorhabdus marina]